MNKIRKLASHFFQKLSSIEYEEYEQLGEGEAPPETVRNPGSWEQYKSPRLRIREEEAHERNPDDRVTTFRNYSQPPFSQDIDSDAPTERGMNFQLTDEDLGLINSSLHYLKRYWESGDPDESKLEIEKIDLLLRKVRALKNLN